MSDTDRTHSSAIELEESALDEISAGVPASFKAPIAHKVQSSPWVDGNITSLDDWEKHNV